MTLARRSLAKAGIAVSELALGVSFVARQGQAVVSAGVAAAQDAGVDYFDTAPYYSAGEDERMLGVALAGRREQVRLATKVGYTDDPGDHRRADGLMRQLEQSLARLATDRVDVVQVHEADFRKWWSGDPLTVEQGMDPRGALIADDEDYDFAGAPVVEFLRRARAEGKARFVGLTGKDARRLARVARAVDVDTVMVAHQFNPVLRNAAAFLFGPAAATGLGVFVGAPLMMGWLAVPRDTWRTAPPPWMDATFQQAYVGCLDLAASAGIPLAELTLRWMLGESRLQSLVFGFRGAGEVRDNLRAAARGPLDPALAAAIDALGIVHPLLFQGRTTL